MRLIMVTVNMENGDEFDLPAVGPPEFSSLDSVRKWLDEEYVGWSSVECVFLAAKKD